MTDFPFRSRMAVVRDGLTYTLLSQIDDVWWLAACKGDNTRLHEIDIRNCSPVWCGATIGALAEVVRVAWEDPKLDAIWIDWQQPGMTLGFWLGRFEFNSGVGSIVLVQPFGIPSDYFPTREAAWLTAWEARPNKEVSRG